ncbi:glycosyltransferase family 2 protein [Microbacterium sp. zg.Y1090]|uniref:glycosyltransferase n=1 Tax=Microbacterium TaxID=33882 RepID=UPI00214D076B|nr:MULTISPECIES: glycosyltransferase family 2 protein [unclassified Microbacterium]MCR2814070.1 glycosyltransferase family 2 protein [Microbacterium sp. zg.Y1084]MCR2817925.1 glycosyltransferase family 2 protein [Microbacterium sp. zg.Y1090]MDL5487779.1 glycosyltransferase family 2 protein [Microbacterium sp. zg-Y1211]WIM27910.1 glycosyltransferase family 2 protein [Microbacterium sp. zg-Y1090]
MSAGQPPTEDRLHGEYVLPLRWSDDAGLRELTEYLLPLASMIDVTVVDGSEVAVFEAHARAWPFLRHVPPAVSGANGKACGAVTGLGLARHDKVVIADDDVRYGREQLAEALDRLDRAELVRPQNVFVPAPWHARWDTGRTLLNRALGGDFCGTVAVRRSVLPHGRYDTDVLFENLELERTVRAAGGRVDVASDLYVPRRPSSVNRFFEQRVRQAYDDFAQPVRLVRELALLPALALLVRVGGARVLVPVALVVVALAEVGRVRGGGRTWFRRTDTLWAVAWAAERTVTVWIAAALRLRGGVRYRDARILRAATPLRALRRTA